MRRISRTKCAAPFLLSGLVCGGILAADESMRRPDEFALAGTDGQRRGPDTFMRQHAIRQAWPSSVERVNRLEAADRSWKSYSKVKLQALSESRSGVWRTVGPATVSDDGDWELWEPKNSSGRVTSMAIGSQCNASQCRLYVGAAGGGLWRTDDALNTQDPGWQRLGAGLTNNNIGVVVLDPNDASDGTIYVGTGETNFSYSSAAGEGLFRSTDGGDTFTRVSTLFDGLDFTATRGISQVAVEPGDPRTLYLTTTTALQGMTSVRGGQSTITGLPQAEVGLYRTTNGGASWERLFVAPITDDSSSGTHAGIYERVSGVKDVQLDPRDPGTVYISVLDDGVYRLSPALDGDQEFHKVFEIVRDQLTREAADSYAAFDLTVKDGKTRIYLYNGCGAATCHDFQKLYRVEDASVPHHALYFANQNRAVWVDMTQLESAADYEDFSICNGQCVYDLVVAVPDGRPDTVFLGGQLNRYLGDPAMRSNNGGESFYSLGIDRQTPPGTPHVDVRSIVFSPEDPDIAFIGSDGGVVRTDGEYGSGAYHCSSTFGYDPSSARGAICREALAEVPESFVFMNRGLQTMQLYNISADPSAPLARQMAGTQDNSTQWNDGAADIREWTKVFNIGDGTSANGFHPTDPNILFASYQSNWFFTHFNGGQGGAGSWTITSWPIQQSEEATDPVGPTGRQFLTFDPSDPDTQYTGFEHVWRTRNNGGDRNWLQANCSLASGTYGPGCGDWEPLGDFLTRQEFGDDRVGGVIVAAERSSGDTGTLWAATSLGRVFISRNVDAPAAAVSFDRLDSSATPPRFVSGIAVDSSRPNRAFISFSGFSAVTPETPGHLFEVVEEGGSAVFTSIDYNLGDMPITHLVRDDLTGDLYAATDFGVLVLPAGTRQWLVAGEGLPTVLTPHLEIHPQERLLFAATHGMGAWYLDLPAEKTVHCLEPSASKRKGPRPAKLTCPSTPPGNLE